MMNEEFVKILGKSSSKLRNIGIFILIMGLVFGATGVFAVDNMGSIGQVFLLLLGGLSVLIAILLISKSVKSNTQLKNGQHPLMNAIDNGDRGFVLWYHQYITTVDNVQAGADHQIWIYDCYNKNTVISVKGARVPDMLTMSHGCGSRLLGLSPLPPITPLYKSKLV